MSAKKKRTKYHHGELREALLAAALDLIAERGLAHLSLRECARRAEVSHAAPYRHFKDKDALVRAIAHQGFAILAAEGREAMDQHREPRARLDAYGVAYVRFALNHPEHHRAMFTSETEITESAEDPGAFSLLVEGVSALLEDGADPIPAAFAFWSLVHGISMLILDGRVPEMYLGDIDALVRGTFAHWRAG